MRRVPVLHLLAVARYDAARSIPGDDGPHRAVSSAVRSDRAALPEMASPSMEPKPVDGSLTNADALALTAFHRAILFMV
jgi:hypothetical protein